MSPSRNDSSKPNQEQPKRTARKKGGDLYNYEEVNATGETYFGGTHYHYDAPEKSMEVVNLLLDPDWKPSTFFEPETILVPAGPFMMGSAPGDGISDYETPQHEVILPVYRIGKYPVTNAQYEKFINQNKNKFASSSMGWDGQRVPKEKENYPVTGVTWHDALEYCNWLKEKTGREYTLPNEAQWEKACRGDGKTLYPWGDEFDDQRCNYGKPELAPVDAFPTQSKYGFDFVGNVRQWTCTLWGEDRFTPDPRYPYNEWQDDDRNDVEAGKHIRRVVRGSSGKDNIKLLRCSARNGHLPSETGSTDILLGFRVAMSFKP